MGDNSIKPDAIVSGQLVCQCKGGRKYVHGTDIFNMFFQSLSENCLFLGDFRDISASFKKILTSRTVHYNVYDCRIADKNAHVAISFIANNQRYYAVLTGLREDPVSESYPFNENNINKHCLVDIQKKKIVLTEELDFTVIEICTAMNKKLLNGVFPPEKKWLMTKFELYQHHGVKKYRSIAIVMEKAVKLKLVKSSIYFDKIKAGSIYFSESK